MDNLENVEVQPEEEWMAFFDDRAEVGEDFIKSHTRNIGDIGIATVDGVMGDELTYQVPLILDKYTGDLKIITEEDSPFDLSDYYDIRVHVQGFQSKDPVYCVTRFPCNGEMVEIYGEVGSDIDEHEANYVDKYKGSVADWYFPEQENDLPPLALFMPIDLELLKQMKFRFTSQKPTKQ